LIAGFYLASVFAPAHMSLPIVTDHDDTWRLQFETTRNFVLPKWLSFFFIGLDYQLEHHLFMRAPHQNLAKIAEYTQRWAAERDLPYYVVDYTKGWTDVMRYMEDAWRLEPTDPDSMRSWPVRTSEVDRTAEARRAEEPAVALAAA
jgi:fatty acid desaturase